MELEEALYELHETGGILRRKTWDAAIGISLEDAIASDWEVVDYSEDDE